MAKWPSVARLGGGRSKAPVAERLAALFTGYRPPHRDAVLDAAALAGLGPALGLGTDGFPATGGSPGANSSRSSSSSGGGGGGGSGGGGGGGVGGGIGCPPVKQWTSAHVHRLVAFFLRDRFPVLVGFNKCDDDRHAAHLERVRRMHPTEAVVPMSAHAETVLLAAAAAAAANASAGTVSEPARTAALASGARAARAGAAAAGRVASSAPGAAVGAAVGAAAGGAPSTAALDAAVRCCEALGGSTGVREALDAAVALAGPTVVYLILVPLTSSGCGATGATGTTGSKSSSSGNSGGGSGGGLWLAPCDVAPLLFRRGVTPGDVYEHLHHRAEGDCLKLSGDFIRAEAVVAVGNPVGSGGGLSLSRVVLKKDAPLEDSQRVIKIYTNKAKSWQKQR